MQPLRAFVVDEKERMSSIYTSIVCCLALGVFLLFSVPVFGQDFTCFQTAAPYAPALDIASDMAVVYGMNDSFEQRVKQWREQGYRIGMMTGVAWGNYGDYYQTDEGFRKEEVQTRKSGQLYMHGNSTTVGYNVPSEAYVSYLKKKVSPAVDAGATAIFLEEPEYWAQAGWSEGFKESWQKFYGESWQVPDSSVDAQYRASKLKYELYFNALKEVFSDVKARAAALGTSVECHVPTHSLVNYAQWGIVSPESHLMDLPESDGYIAQVWTGTSRTPNLYRGVKKERTFEAAYLEYSQMLGMVRPTGRKVWFLADPIEDNPNYSWANYKENYECTIIASLLFPEVARFEVMPWPNRIFKGSYPKVDLDTKSGEKEGIPAAYATELLAVINALNDMRQDDVRYDMGTKGIGVLISDSIMFQRANPHASEHMLSSFFGLAMPLLKRGVPVDVVQLENVVQAGALAKYKVLLLTYEGQKPLKPAYHTALAQWVRDGGALLYVGDGSDLYHNVREWWNDEGKNENKAYTDLFKKLGVTQTAYHEPIAVGKGFVRVFKEKPRKLARYKYGADEVIAAVEDLMKARGDRLAQQDYLGLQRGPYHIYSVLDEVGEKAAYTLRGHFIDVFDPAFTLVSERTLGPGQRGLFYDLDWKRAQKNPIGVVACAGRLRDETVSEHRLQFSTRGPNGVTGRVCIVLPNAPKEISVEPQIPFTQDWDTDNKVLRISHAHQAKALQFKVSF